MNALTRRGGSLFDDFFRDFSPGYFIQPLHGEPLPSQIKLDLQERDGAFEVQAEIPGVKKDDIRVEVNGDMLTLQAEVKQEDARPARGGPCAWNATTARSRARCNCRPRSTRRRPRRNTRTACCG